MHTIASITVVESGHTVSEYARNVVVLGDWSEKKPNCLSLQGEFSAVA